MGGIATNKITTFLVEAEAEAAEAALKSTASAALDSIPSPSVWDQIEHVKKNLESLDPEVHPPSLGKKSWLY